MQRGFVSLVGAGPGHPGLLTVRAVECLRQADLVLYDRLVPESMLDYARPGADKRCVSDLAPHHVERYLPVRETMIAAAREGKRVVRLKGGDPCIFGRAGEEAETLHEAGIAFEIIPGVTAALGAACFTGIPLTHRQHASAVAFITGHETADKGETAIDWQALARFPGTVVVYMGMSRVEKIVQALVDAGKDPLTPCAAVRNATRGDQKTVEAPLEDLPATIRTAGLDAPSLIIIGSVVKLRGELAWFEKLPLFGKGVLVTRPRHQAGDLVQRLADLGAVPHVLPALEIRPPADWAPVDRALRSLARFQWIVFTSANGVYAFIQRLRALGQDIRSLGGVKLAAIGPKTALALDECRLIADLVPARFQSEDLAAALLERVEPGWRILLVRAEQGRDVLRVELSRRCDVEQIAVYSQTDAIAADHPALGSLRRGEMHYITLTSSNIARAVLRALDGETLDKVRNGDIKLVSISPVTSQEIRLLGLPVAAEAVTATSEGVIEALVRVNAERENPRSTGERGCSTS